jgi:hypothetical protein
MAKRMVAYCGIVCTECDAFIATQAEDRTALEQMAKRASEEFGMAMTVEDAMCDGCLATTGRQIGYCTQCAIRACGVDNLVENCAHCEEYACPRIEVFAKPGSKHRATLDGIREGLDKSL